MTETMNINTLKGRILVMAVLLVALAAAMAVMAKPAEAAVCSAKSESPYFHTDIGGRRWIYFASSINCSGGSVDGFSIHSKGYQYYGGRWNLVADSYRITKGSGSSHRVIARVLCTGDYTPYAFRTNNITPQIKVNGVWKTLAVSATQTTKEC